MAWVLIERIRQRFCVSTLSPPLTIKDKSNEKMKIIADATNQEYIYLFTGGILVMYEPRRCTYT